MNISAVRARDPHRLETAIPWYAVTSKRIKEPNSTSVAKIPRLGTKARVAWAAARLRRRVAD